MKKIRALIVVPILALSLAAAICAPFAGSFEEEVPCEAPLIRFDESGTFTVLQLTDFHEWMGIEDGLFAVVQETLSPLLEVYIDQVLDEVKPSLVVLTGDNVFPLKAFYDLGEGVSIKTYKRFAEIFEARGQYWTMTFGNHDSESVKNKLDFLQAVEGYPHFIGGVESGETYKSAVFDGIRPYEDKRVGNFSIPVYGADGNPAFNLYLLDSGSNTSVRSGPYHYISDEQTEWFLERAAELKAGNGGASVPSIMFTHIPLIETEEAYLQNGEMIGAHYSLSPSDVRSSIFEAAMDEGGVRGIFFGHNHFVSMTCFYTRGDRKIMMGVTPQCATDDYSDTSSILYGRVIQIKEDGNFTTWIHTSNKSSYPDGVFRGETLSYDD